VPTSFQDGIGVIGRGRNILRGKKKESADSFVLPEYLYLICLARRDGGRSPREGGVVGRRGKRRKKGERSTSALLPLILPPFLSSDLPLMRKKVFLKEKFARREKEGRKNGSYRILLLLISIFPTLSSNVENGLKE